jgi:hypothetical protein
MPEESAAPTDEQSALWHIAALIKNYEPQFDLHRSFTPGVLGCSDRQYAAIKGEWLDDLDQKGITNTNALVAKGLLKEVIDHTRQELELSWQEVQPADSRFNWRVTVPHGDYFIHIMAVDKKFKRFAFSLQTEGDLKAGLTSDSPRPSSNQYKVVNHLSELKPVLDNLYEIFKRQDQQERINRAVAEEREKWEKRLAKERENRLLNIYIFIFIAILFVGGYIANAINEYFNGVPVDVVLTILGAGIGALIGTLLYFWGTAWIGLKVGLLKDGRPAPLFLRSGLIVFFVLWIALAYASFSGLI